MKKYFAILSVALLLGLLVGMLGFATVGADPLIGDRIQLPRIDVDDGWGTWIQVFNKGDVPTYAVIRFWGDPGDCPPTANDPVGTLCRQVQDDGVWTVKHEIPALAKSAIVKTFATKPVDCGATTGPKFTDPATGEAVAVTVDRIGPNDYTPSTTVASVYTGISDEMHGAGPTFTYFVPYVMVGYHNLDTVITIQNSGTECASGWLYFSEQGICNMESTYHVDLLAPGEARRITAADLHAAGIPCNWLGSGYIQCSQELGIIVDQISDPDADACASTDRGMMLSWRAMPYKQVGEVVWDTAWYADLVFREWSGWNSSIQVQNLTQKSVRTFVTVDFMNESGDQLPFYMAEWVLADCATTFYLPVITDLGAGYVGAAEIKSHPQVDFPGETHLGEPIFVIVDLKHPDTGQGGAYNAHPESEKEWAWDVALPHLSKGYQDVTSLIGLRNNANCNKIKPRIDFKTEEGETICFLDSKWLDKRHVWLVDLATIGCLPGNWVGAAEVIITDHEQLCDVDHDGLVDNEPVMLSVVVVNRGTGSGDTTRIYEGFPIVTATKPCYGTIFGNVIDDNELEPINEVTVTFDSVYTTTTNSNGNYEMRVDATKDYTVMAAKSGWLTRCETDVSLDCGVREPVDFELRCASNIFTGVVTEEDNIVPVAEPEVSIVWDPPYVGAEIGITSTGTVTGFVKVDSLPKLKAAEALTATITKDGFDPWTKTYTRTTFSECPVTVNERLIELCALGTVEGTVTDGTVGLPGFTIKAILDGEVVLETVSSDSTAAAVRGTYKLEGLSTGFGKVPHAANIYTIRCEKIGYPSKEETEVFGTCGQIIPVDFTYP